MRTQFVLRLPRFIFHSSTLVTIAAIHVYLSVGHLLHLAAGEIEWTHIWKGFGALIGAYVFTALATRRFAVRQTASLAASTSER
jgi:hypothetical protein